jgi:hypothetical protein
VLCLEPLDAAKILFFAQSNLGNVLVETYTARFDKAAEAATFIRFFLCFFFFSSFFPLQSFAKDFPALSIGSQSDDDVANSNS